MGEEVRWGRRRSCGGGGLLLEEEEKHEEEDDHFVNLLTNYRLIDEEERDN